MLRLYPNREEERRLVRNLDLCRWTYNQLLEAHNNGITDHNDLSRFLTALKKEHPELNEVYSKCLQPECDRLFRNIRAQNALRQRGRKVGKLRFKSKSRFRSFTYNQSGFELLPKNDKFGFLHLSKIGDIPIRLHHTIEGEIKEVIVKHMPSGKWYAYILIDDGRGEDKLDIIENAVGIDVGLEHYAVDSDGLETENPCYLKQALKRLRKEQHRLMKKQKCSKNREKQRVIVARKYEKVANQRNDFQHKLSRQYVDNYDMIVTEDLDNREMIENSHLAREISDASWSSLNSKIAYKAERAGKLFVQVDARGTSQTCPSCGRIEKKLLNQRVHDCPCGFHTSRDHAASLVILQRGLRKVRSERPELTLVDMRPLQLPASSLQVAWLKQEAPPARRGSSLFRCALSASCGRSFADSKYIPNGN
jgi:putative transposase